MNIARRFFCSDAVQRICIALLFAIPVLLATTRAGADIALSIVAGVFLVRSIQAHDWAWLGHAEMRVLVVLWLAMLYMAQFSPSDPSESFMQALKWGRFIVFFAAARFWLFPRPGVLGMANNIALAALLLVAGHVLWQYAVLPSGSRLMIPFSQNPNVGHYMLKIGLPTLGLLAYRMMAGDVTRRLWVPGAALLALMVLVLLTGERSAGLLTLLGLGTLGLVVMINQPKLRKVVFGLGIVAIGILVLLAATQTVVQERGMFLIEQIADFWNTVYGQLYIGAWRLWLEYPFTGVGIKQYLPMCESANLGTTYCDIHAHNTYLEWLVVTGIFGVGLYVAAIILMGRRLLRELSFSGANGVLAAFACAGFAVLVFPFIVAQSPFSNWPAITHWYSLALVLSMGNIARSKS